MSQMISSDEEVASPRFGASSSKELPPPFPLGSESECDDDDDDDDGVAQIQKKVCHPHIDTRVCERRRCRVGR